MLTPEQMAARREKVATCKTELVVTERADALAVFDVYRDLREQLREARRQAGCLADAARQAIEDVADGEFHDAAERLGIALYDATGEGTKA